MSSLDYLELCRLCLVKDNVSLPIFEDEGDERQIYFKISSCLPVKVLREDKLPKKICDECGYKVELLYQFWNTSVNAEKQLLQWLGEVGGLEEKQDFVTAVLDPSALKQDRSGNTRLDGNVLQVSGQGNIDINMIDNMSIITIPAGSEQQFTTVPMDTSVVQAVAGPSTQVTHEQLVQSQADVSQIVGEESEEDNYDDGCDNDDGMTVKEETEEDHNEQSTFANVSLPCDEAGPSGLQQSELTAQTADGDPKSGTDTTPSNSRKKFVFRKRLVKITPLQQMKAAKAAARRAAAQKAKAAEGLVLYVCKPCKVFFPHDKFLALHNSVVHGQSVTIIRERVAPNAPKIPVQESKKTQSKRYLTIQGTISEQSGLVDDKSKGYHLINTGQYVCDSCNFRSAQRSSIVDHVNQLHDNQLVIKSEVVDEDDEASWPMETIENSLLEPGQVNQIKVAPTERLLRKCPYCPFKSEIRSTFHSHVKRKHGAGAVDAQETVEKVQVHQCAHCTFQAEKSSTLQWHVKRKHRKEWLEAVARKVALKSETGQMDVELAEQKDEQELQLSDYEDEDEIEEGSTKADVHKCSACDFRGASVSSVRAHKARMHRGHQSNSERANSRRTMIRQCTGYACHYCTFVAATVASINAHTAREHSSVRPAIKEVPVSEYDCDQCEYKSRERRSMQHHLKVHALKANEEGMYACNVCVYETNSKMGLQRHISIKHYKPRREAAKLDPEACLSCDECSFKCLNAKTMDWHRRQHEASDNAEEGISYFCDDCDFSTWTKGQLASHIKRKHKDEDRQGEVGDASGEGTLDAYPCDQCDHISKNKHSLKVHVIRKHTSEFNHECELCGKKYKVKADLTNHIRFQHREQPIICDVCGKTCRNSNLLYLHQKFAHYKPDFECHICHRRMVSQANLDEHVLKQHEQREDVVCDECGKTFTKQARLKIHKRVHTGVKPYTCKICGKAFARRNGLRQHLLIHTGQRPYECDICKKAFTQKTGLISHRKSHPGNHPPLPRVTIEHVLSDLLNEEES